ncbi:adenylate/guanylate cyclase domain-containing protein [Myxococcota bacterium]|nr:adenylate/guanylate cyclase domain-containing protein [Myxococcota bacterium]
MAIHRLHLVRMVAGGVFGAVTVLVGPILRIDPLARSLPLLALALVLSGSAAMPLWRLRRGGAVGGRAAGLFYALLDTVIVTLVGLLLGGVHTSLPLLYTAVIAAHALRLQVPPLVLAVVGAGMGYLAMAWLDPAPPGPERQVVTLAVYAMVGMAAAEGSRLGRALAALALQRQRERIETEQSLARYFSPQVREILLARKGERLPSQHREVTALFADLSGFTALGEAAPEVDVIETLDAYIQALADVATSRDGTVDNYLGDGVLVVFNAPLDQPDHAARAVETARAMQRVAQELSLQRRRQGRPALGLTIGLNTGPAVAGPVGGEARLQYTVIGDPVNVASRLQAEGHEGDLIVGEATARAAGLDGPWEQAPIRGRNQPVRFLRLRAA